MILLLLLAKQNWMLLEKSAVFLYNIGASLIALYQEEYLKITCGFYCAIVLVVALFAEAVKNRMVKKKTMFLCALRQCYYIRRIVNNISKT